MPGTIKISQLPPDTTPDTTAKIPMVIDGVTVYVTAAELIELAFANIPSDISLISGWSDLGDTPDTVTYLGNRSYQCVFNNVDHTNVLHMKSRVRVQSTTLGATRCTSLNGTNQYFSKSSPAGTTFTDDYAIGGWFKLTSYPASEAAFFSRYNGTSGFTMTVDSTGRVANYGYNGGSGNLSGFFSNASIPLNKWFWLVCQNDMSAFTNTSTTAYMMINGENSPVSMFRTGTNPTALIQAGNLEVGARNGGGLPLLGKVANLWYTSAKITQANALTLYSQTITAAQITAQNIVSAWSFDNNINDINTTNANNLTANNSATATNADSYRGYQSNGTFSSSLDYGVISSPPTFSTNTTVVIQVPEGCTLPTTGGVTEFSYSNAAAPYLFPSQRERWSVETCWSQRQTATAANSSTWYNPGSLQVSVPIGAWTLGWQSQVLVGLTATNYPGVRSALSTSASSVSDQELFAAATLSQSSSNQQNGMSARSKNLSVTTATPYYFILQAEVVNGTTTLYAGGYTGAAEINVLRADFALL